jgi:hypothetical protein
MKIPFAHAMVMHKFSIRLTGIRALNPKAMETLEQVYARSGMSPQTFGKRLKALRGGGSHGYNIDHPLGEHGSLISQGRSWHSSTRRPSWGGLGNGPRSATDFMVRPGHGRLAQLKSMADEGDIDAQTAYARLGNVVSDLRLTPPYSRPLR